MLSHQYKGPVIIYRGGVGWCFTAARGVFFPDPPSNWIYFSWTPPQSWYRFCGPPPMPPINLPNLTLSGNIQAIWTTIRSDAQAEALFQTIAFGLTLKTVNTSVNDAPSVNDARAHCASQSVHFFWTPPPFSSIHFFQMSPFNWSIFTDHPIETPAHHPPYK